MDRVYELIKLSQSGDNEAKSLLVKENSGLIWSIVRKFHGRGYEAEDLFQIGAIGLLKCIDKFDTSFEVKFSTYAVPMIMGEIKRFLRDDGMIKISRPLKEMAVKAKYIRESLVNKNNTEPTIEELAKEMEVDRDDLILALESSKDVESIYATVYQGDGSPIYLVDKLEEKKGGENSVIDLLALKDIIAKLDMKERQIIKLRYFEDKTQSEIAGIIGISQVQVSRIEKRVLKNIREKFG